MNDLIEAAGRLHSELEAIHYKIGRKKMVEISYADGKLIYEALLHSALLVQDEPAGSSERERKGLKG